MQEVLIFDLDDTLVVEEPAAAAAFEATARVAEEHHRLDRQALARTARSRARELWYATPAHPYCARIGISSWEGLWCRFEGADPNVRWLRDWSASYRCDAWRLALEDQGIEDLPLARELGERFGAERRERHEPYPEVLDSLRALRDTHRFALITNGLCCLQREKLAASGLEEFFDAVIISAEVGVGKPDPRVFEHALSQVGSDAEHAVMIGDNLTRDVDGALAAGLHGVWVNRRRIKRPPDRPDLVEVTTLSELPSALQTLSPSGG